MYPGVSAPVREPARPLTSSAAGPSRWAEWLSVPALLMISMVGLVIATAIGVALLTLQMLDARLVPLRLQLVAKHTQASVQDVEAYAQNARADVLALSGGTALGGYIRAIAAGGIDPVDNLPTAEWQDRLAKRLLHEAQAKPAYHQIRIVGAADGGREAIRVDRNRGPLRVAPADELQQKGNTEYFQATMKLGMDGIYVSPIELNKEQGLVEAPVVPVIRVAAPLFFQDDSRFGILIVELDLRPIFHQLASRAPDGSDVRMVNADGDYLLHPDSTKAFKFDQGGRSSFDDDLPDLRLPPKHETFYGTGRDHAGERIGVAATTGLMAGATAFSVLNVVPYAALAAADAPFRQATLIAGSIAAMASVGLALLLANMLSRRIRSAVTSVDNLSSEELATAGIPVRRGLSDMLHRFFRDQPVEELRDELVRRRRAELLMRSYSERDRLYSAVVESADDAVVTKTLDGKITGWNPSAERLFGFTAEEAIGRPIDIIVPAERHDDVAHILGKISRGERVQHYETLRRTKSGRLIDVALSISPVRSADGEIIGAAKIARDITEQEFVERKFQLSVEASPGGVLILDASGRIALINGELERQFGYSRSELIGQPVELLLPDNFRANHVGLREGFFASPAVRPMGNGRELFGQRKDGSQFPMEIGLNPIRSRETMIVLATVVDISIRKEAQSAIARQNEQLRRSNEELEQFAYIASHDLQEPLRMVSSFTQLLSERYRGRLDERADKYIGYAVEGATRMQALIRDLLSYSRLASGDREPKPVDSATVVSAVLQRMARLVQESGSEIRVGVLPKVMSDETQLGQVFQNLISNAVKFRSDRPPLIEISARQDRGMWEFAVKDNGIGIDAKDSDRIFQMFQRLHERGKYDGSGIGLAIAKKVVERHGGRIWFTSDPGCGTTFCFTLPSADGP